VEKVGLRKGGDSTVPYSPETIPSTAETCPALAAAQNIPNSVFLKKVHSITLFAFMRPLALDMSQRSRG